MGAERRSRLAEHADDAAAHGRRGWQQEKVAQSAQAVHELGRELHKRLATFAAHLAKLGRSLDSAVGAYNEAVGSFESRVLVQARKLEDHGISGTSSRRRRSSGRRARSAPSEDEAAVARAPAGRPRGLTARGTPGGPISSFSTVKGTLSKSRSTWHDVTDVRNVIVIGGGPAGYTAALYAARANLEPLVIEGFNWGGQLMITSDVENYPGYADGVMGPAMMQDFRRQAERFGTTFVTDDVTRVDFSQRPFRVWVGDDEYRADSVIVATGASARQLGLESELRLQGRGVSYCATCDAAFFRDKVVVVVGGGDSAMEEALFISRFASKVYLVHRREEFRASPIMVDRARANEKIELVLNKVVDEVLGDVKVTGVRLEDTRHRRESTLETDGLFVAIGHDPNTAPVPRPARPRARHRLPPDARQVDRDEHPRRVRRRRRAGSRVPPGRHRRRLGLRRRARRRAVAERAAPRGAVRASRRVVGHASPAGAGRPGR